MGFFFYRREKHAHIADISSRLHSTFLICQWEQDRINSQDIGYAVLFLLSFQLYDNQIPRAVWLT